MRKLILLFFCFFSLSNVQAQNRAKKTSEWVYSNRDAENEKCYIKSKCITKKGDEIRVWVKRISDSKELGGKSYQNVTILELIVADCKNKKIATLRKIAYSDFMSNIISDESFNDLQWEYVIPETCGEGMLNKICELFNK